MKPDELAGGKLLLDQPAEAVARLTLNRPDSRNALDHETLDALAEAMPALDRGIEIRCEEGQSVSEGDVLVVLE